MANASRRQFACHHRDSKAADGGTISGRVTQVSDFRITLVDGDGETHVIEREPGVDVQMNDPLAAHQAMIRPSRMRTCTTSLLIWRRSNETCHCALRSRYDRVSGPTSPPNVSLDPKASEKRPSTSWTTFNGDYSGQRYSTLTQITPANVNQIAQQWVYKISSVGAQRGASKPVIKCTPLLVNGVLYITIPDHLFASTLAPARNCGITTGSIMAAI